MSVSYTHLATQIWFSARVLPATDPLFKDLKMPDAPASDAPSALKGPLHRYIVDMKVDPHWLNYESDPEMCIRDSYMTHISVFIYFGWFDLKMDPYGIPGNLAVVVFRLVVCTAVAAALWYGFESQILKLKRFF